MNKQSTISSCLAALLALFVLVSASEAFAARSGKDGYSGSNMSCLMGNDFYAVHFSAFQPGRRAGESTDFTKYCQEIPGVGTTYLSIDLLDRDVRKTPISLRVVEEEFSEDGGRPPGPREPLQPEIEQRLARTLAPPFHQNAPTSS